MSVRLLTVMAYTVLAVLCAAGTAQAGISAPKKIGTGWDISANGDGSCEDMIYFRRLVVSSDDVPFVVVSMHADMGLSSGAGPGKWKMALYDTDFSTVLDSTEEGSCVATTPKFYGLNCVSHASITSGGVYWLALWGDVLAGADIEKTHKTAETADTTYYMTSQDYTSDAWPSLDSTGKLVSYAMPAGIVAIHGDAAIGGEFAYNEDTEIDEGVFGADFNFGGITTYITCEETNGACQYPLLSCKDVAANLGSGKTVDACTLWIHTNTIPDAGTVSLYQVFKPWVGGDSLGADPTDDGTATWNDFTNDDEEWGTAGCESASDDGSDNSTDGGGYDRTATAMSTTAISSAGTWYALPISTALAQAWYDKTANENGVTMRIGNNDEINFHSSENENGCGPIWQFFTSDVAEGGRRTRVEKLLGR